MKQCTHGSVLLSHDNHNTNFWSAIFYQYIHPQNKNRILSVIPISK